MSNVNDKANWKTHYTVRRYENDEAFHADKPFDVSEFEQNVLLNAGIAELWDLVIAAGGTTAFDNTNARIGVGDSSTAAAATQTALQAATNTAFASMESSYPSRTSQTVTWRAVFGGTAANFAWNEFVIDNGGTSPVTLNRKVSSQGTKSSGQTWTVDVSITIS